MIYTFRTFPAVDELRRSSNVFVFGKLKEDLAAFGELLTKNRPALVLGIATTNGPSRIEPTAINKFGNGKIVGDGPDALELFVPDSLPSTLAVASKPTHTFCNWTMYKVQELINSTGLPAKLIFLHINKHDLPRLKEILEVIA